MFLQLAHTKLDIYGFVRNFTRECYILSNKLPPEERYNMVTQLRRAALSVHLNNAEGCSRKSDLERKRYFEIARGSLVEIDAALDGARELDYLEKFDLFKLSELIILCFKLLTGLIRH